MCISLLKSDSLVLLVALFKHTYSCNRPFHRFSNTGQVTTLPFSKYKVHIFCLILMNFVTAIGAYKIEVSVEKSSIVIMQ